MFVFFNPHSIQINRFAFKKSISESLNPSYLYLVYKNLNFLTQYNVQIDLRFSIKPISNYIKSRNIQNSEIWDKYK